MQIRKDGLPLAGRAACAGEGRPTVYADLLRRALAWAVKDDIFADLSRHGNTTWLTHSLVVLALLWVWSSFAKLTEAFAEAKRLSERILGTAAVGSYQGLTQALVRHTPQIMPLLWGRLHVLMEQTSPGHWRIGRWRPL